MLTPSRAEQVDTPLAPLTPEQQENRTLIEAHLKQIAQETEERFQNVAVKSID